jgi:group I intron endonuclease
MRIFKSHPLLKLVNSYIIDSPQPSNLSYLWNFGSLLAVCLIIQIITGVTLAMHYNPSVLEAFNSVEHIMRDVNNGWLIRYLHSNTASAFFFLVYLHIGRGLYYGSYRSPRTLVWAIGTVIFILMMATAFLGFLTIAQNGLNSIKQWQQKQKQQKQFSSEEANNEAWWLQQQDNSIRYDRPSEESQESFYLEELFDDNPYSNTDNQEKRSDSKLSEKFDTGNKFDKSSFTSGKRHYLTLSKRYYSTSGRDLPSNSKILTEFLLEKNLKPVYVYENLSEDSTKKKILEETRGLSGIYLILNKVTKDYYIGSASNNKIYTRFARHLINLSGSKVVKNAVKKYKISEFAFLVLEIFPEIVTQENNQKLLNLEDFYLKSLLPNYNILTEAGSSFGYKHSELTRIKMKSNYSDERRERIGNLNRNKKFSEATILLMKEKALNREKIVYSEQGMANMKKNSKSIIVYNLDKTIYGKYLSIVDTAKNLNCDIKTVSRSLKSPNKLLKKRWIVNYL